MTIPTIPADLQMTAVFLLGLVIGSVFGLFVGILRGQEAAHLRGRNLERAAHGDDLLVPAPKLHFIHTPGGPIP